jgi:F0F1-type ATP synthase delta subunit
MAKTKRTEVAAVIANLMAQDQPEAKLSQQVAAYLVDAHQTKDLDAILRDVLTARAKSGVVEADITTAFPLSSEVRAQVQKLLRQEYPDAQQFVLQESVEPEVLSGIRIQTPDRQLDETARGKLDQLTRNRI